MIKAYHERQVFGEPSEDESRDVRAQGDVRPGAVAELDGKNDSGKENRREDHQTRSHRPEGAGKLEKRGDWHQAIIPYAG